MSHHPRPGLTVLVLASAALALASCASHTVPPLASGAAPGKPAGAGSDSRSIWRLRSGLNVAALSCRGRSRTAVAPAYRRMLERHKQVFAASYRSEVTRYGMAGFDHDQTRVYNHFANQRSPSAFCSTAAEVADRASRIDSGRFGPEAPRLLAQLERGLR
ncbi:MAG: hypothetical protein KGL48_08345 [Sphingomonadales bacterium]|nr:hypothetical protein [Sphingomonadales bacterium]MDE2568892.1 hypothetical protein [Sphingomonadales bacterium]